MIYASTSLSPKNTVIDATEVNRFSWTVRGSAQTAYHSVIRKNSDNSLIYDSATPTTSNPYYDLSASTLTNGIEYKWTVTTFSGLDSATSEYVYFVARNNPTVTFSDPVFSATPTVITSQDYTFQATYSQLQSISLKKYKFILYDSAGTTEIEDSGWIYGFSPEYEFTGMSNSTTYNVECKVVSQDDIEATTGQKEFSIAYTLPDATPDIDIEALDSAGSIRVSWADLKQLLGVVSGSSSYVTGKFNQALQLENSATLTLTDTIPDTYAFSYWVKLQYGHDGAFMKLGTDIYIGYDYATRKFYYDNGTTTYYTDTMYLFAWEDFESGTWVDYSGATWEVPFALTEFTYNWIFVGLNSDDELIIKVYDEIRAEI